MSGRGKAKKLGVKAESSYQAVKALEASGVTNINANKVKNQADPKAGADGFHRALNQLYKVGFLRREKGPGVQVFYLSTVRLRSVARQAL